MANPQAPVRVSPSGLLLRGAAGQVLTLLADGVTAVFQGVAAVFTPAPFRATYNVDPAFAGTQSGSESNPFTTVAAAFAAAVALAQTSAIVYVPPGVTINENLVFPPGVNWEVACQESYVGGSPFAPVINGTVTCDTSGSAVSAVRLTGLAVIGTITGNAATGTSALFLNNCRCSAAVTLTVGTGTWTCNLVGRGVADANGFAGRLGSTLTVAGRILAANYLLVGAVAWTVTSTFVGCTFTSASLTNTAGANTLTFMQCTFTAGNTTVNATAGSCTVSLDGPSMVSASNVGLVAGANVVTKTLNSNGSVRLVAADNVVLRQVYASRIPLSLCVFEYTVTLLAQGTVGLLQVSAVYTDLTGTVKTVAVGPTLNIATAAVGTEISGSLIFSQSGNSPVDFRVDGITTPGALSYSIGVAARQAS